MEKRESLRIHTKKRLRERFGVRGNHKDYIRIREMIRDQKAEFLGRVSHRVSIFLIDEAPGPLKVLYDGKRGEIVTVLTPDQMTETREGMLV